MTKCARMVRSVLSLLLLLTLLPLPACAQGESALAYLADIELTDLQQLENVRALLDQAGDVLYRDECALLVDAMLIMARDDIFQMGQGIPSRNLEQLRDDNEFAAAYSAQGALPSLADLAGYAKARRFDAYQLDERALELYRMHPVLDAPVRADALSGGVLKAQYDQALALLNVGSMESVAQAVEILEDMGDYQDSPQRLTEAQQLLGSLVASTPEPTEAPVISDPIDIIVLYVDEAGMPIADPQSVTVESGTTQSVTAPETIGEYTLVGDITQDITVSVDGIPSAEQVTFMYRKASVPQADQLLSGLQSQDDTEAGDVPDVQDAPDAPVAQPIPIIDNDPINRWAVATISNLRFRAGPTVKAKAIALLLKDDMLFIHHQETHSDGSWYKAIAKGRDGYVNAKYVRLLDDVENAAYNAILASPAPTMPYAEIEIQEFITDPAPAPKVKIVYVYYRDQSDNTLFTESVSCYENENNIIFADPSKIPGNKDGRYTLNDVPQKSVLVDSAGNANPAEVIFRFADTWVNLETKVKVHFRTAEGETLAPSKEEAVVLGINDVYARPDALPNGYTLVTAQPQKVTMAQDGSLSPAEVIFIYQRTETYVFRDKRQLNQPIPTAAPTYASIADAIGSAPTDVPATPDITDEPTAEPATPSPTVFITAPPTKLPKLRKGDISPAVKEMQLKLIELGYLEGAADGEFDSGTLAAVKEFQCRHNLKADGIAGEATLSALYGGNALRKE
ncbi:MAG: peptidoglycan-binding protein [Christensenellales bacterium]|jgi:hypothetical protein